MSNEFYVYIQIHCNQPWATVNYQNIMKINLLLCFCLKRESLDLMELMVLLGQQEILEIGE